MPEVMGLLCFNSRHCKLSPAERRYHSLTSLTATTAKWPGWWFGVKNLNNAVSSNVDKNHAPEDGESETTVQDAVDELNKNPVAEGGKLDTAVRDTLDRLHKDHSAENDEIDTLFYELQSGERMADTVKRGVLLKGLAPILEVQKHVMKDSARLNFSRAAESRSGGSSSCGSRPPYAHGCRGSLHEWSQGKGQDER